MKVDLDELYCCNKCGVCFNRFIAKTSLKQNCNWRDLHCKCPVCGEEYYFEE